MRKEPLLPATTPKQKSSRTAWFKRNLTRLIVACFVFWFIVANVELLDLTAFQDGSEQGEQQHHSSVAGGRDQDSSALASTARSTMTSVVESSAWVWGACGGAVPMYPSSICGRTYCLHSKRHPHVYIDVFYHAFGVISDHSMISLCEEPAGGQVGSSMHRRKGHAAVEVSFIITYKDNPTRTVQCMLELFRTSREADSVEFVLVNDGSINSTAIVDQAAQIIHTHFGILVANVHNRQSVGYGCANNLGVQAASGKYIVLLNNDAFVTPGWLKALLDTIKAERDPGIVGPFFINSNGMVMESGGVVWSNGSAGNYGRFHRPEPHLLYRRNVDYISAACIMMERAIYMLVGGKGLALGSCGC